MRRQRPDEVVTLVDTFEDETEAVRQMHKAARKLRSRRLTGRYGVFVERHPRFKTFQLYLVDMGNK